MFYFIYLLAYKYFCFLVCFLTYTYTALISRHTLKFHGTVLAPFKGTAKSSHFQMIR